MIATIKEKERLFPLRVLFRGKSVLLKVDKVGIFEVFANPIQTSGCNYVSFLTSACICCIAVVNGIRLQILNCNTMVKWLLN